MADAGAILDDVPDWVARLRGELQMHTVWSDGSGSVADMAKAASAQGYSYIAITDHSKGLKIAGRIDEEALERQGLEIEEINNAGSGKTVLRSIEMNRNPRGDADMEPAALARLDLVLGAFHSSLRSKDDQTERYLAAVRNPDVQILAPRAAEFIIFDWASPPIGREFSRRRRRWTRR
ncbi:MAG: PHP domain-containing protein [Verrucomicrobiota bacterium]|nr:PHP domain-containing protein [Verrucomicrobiota bacterium]